MKRILAMLLVLALALSFSACGEKPAGGDGGSTTTTGSTQIEGSKLTAENVAGTGWQCTYFESNGDKVYRRFTLAEDGTYRAIIAINELFDHSENGTYEVKNGKLHLQPESGDPLIYEYKNDHLWHGGNEFTPYSE